MNASRAKDHQSTTNIGTRVEVKQQSPTGFADARKLGQGIDSEAEQRDEDPSFYWAGIGKKWAGNGGWLASGK